MGMASFITSSATPNLSSSSTFSLKSTLLPKLPHYVSIPCQTPKKKLITPVEATRVVKFQGTHRREKVLTEMIEKKVLEAKEVCGENPTTDECKVAWDEVEEVSQAKAHLRMKMEREDPLENFCSENAETDECRVYED